MTAEGIRRHREGYERNLYLSIRNRADAIGYIEHDFAEGRVRGPIEVEDAELARLRKEQEGDIENAHQAFNLILPKDTPRPNDDGSYPPAPEGKEYWHDWAQRMEAIR